MLKGIKAIELIKDKEGPYWLAKVTGESGEVCLGVLISINISLFEHDAPQSLLDSLSAAR